MEPLEALRDAIKHEKAIELLREDGSAASSVKEASAVRFGADLTLSKSTKTALTVSGDAGADTFDLGALVLYWLRQTDSLGDYARQASENGVAIVSFTDRRLVQDLLRGVSSLEGHPRVLGQQGKQQPLNKRPLQPDTTSEVPPPRSTTPPFDPPPTTTTGTVLAESSSTTTKRQKYTVNKEDVERCKRIANFIQGPPYGTQGMPEPARLERQAMLAPNRETVLRGDRTNSFESVRGMVKARMKILQDEQKGTSSSAIASANGSQQQQQQHQQKRRRVDPIIIVSPSSTALINMANVKRFLEESVFEHPDQARMTTTTSSAGAAVVVPRVVEDVITVSHTRATSSISGAPARQERYFIVDNVDSLEKLAGKDGSLNKDAVWDRVVCIFTTGQEWQFKAYKWKQPKELFHHVKGVHAQWTTDPPNEKVRSWNVTELRIDPSKRHIDKSTVANFWRELESWMAMRKPFL